MENIKLQPGDYTTREGIKAYAKRVGLSCEQVYLRICDAFIAGGAPFGEGLGYTVSSSLNKYGWSADTGGIHFGDSDDTGDFTRHLTPDQILSAGKQEDLQSEKQADEVAPKQIGELTLGVGLSADLQETIRSYLWMLDSVKDEDARNIIKEQLADLTNIQFKEYNND